MNATREKNDSDSIIEDNAELFNGLASSSNRQQALIKKLPRQLIRGNDLRENERSISQPGSKNFIIRVNPRPTGHPGGRVIRVPAAGSRGSYIIILFPPKKISLGFVEKSANSIRYCTSNF